MMCEYCEGRGIELDVVALAAVGIGGDDDA